MLQASIAVTGRVFLAILFLISGLAKIGAFDATVTVISSTGLPFPILAYVVTLAIEIGGALLLIVGFQARLAAAALALFTVVAAAFFHNNFVDQNQAIHFFKNIAIAGGLLQVVAVGAGRFSLDARRYANSKLDASASG
jgi:putative oxidoreductase